MLAIFKTGGKQYSVKAGQILKVEKLIGIKGDSVSFNDVLAISDESDYTFGSPIVEGATVQAKILDQIRDKKIIVFKKRQRQNYRHTQGHRQYLTVLQIESIDFGSKKSIAPIKKEIKSKTLDKKESTNEKKVTPKKLDSEKKISSVKKAVVNKKADVKKEK